MCRVCTWRTVRMTPLVQSGQDLSACPGGVVLGLVPPPRWEVAFRCVGQDAQDPKIVYKTHFSVRQEALSQRGNVGLSSASGEVRADTALDWGPDGLADNST